MAKNDLGFTVRRADVEEGREFFRAAAEHVESISVVVEASLWPAYAAALEATSFQTMRTPGGNHLVYVHVPRPVMVDDGTGKVRHVVVWLNCYAAPAPWVRFPAEGEEATRSYKFNVTIED